MEGDFTQKENLKIAKYQRNAIKHYAFFNIKFILFFALGFGGSSYLIRIMPFWDLGLILLAGACYLGFKLYHLMPKENKERIEKLKQRYRDEGLEEHLINRIQFGD